MISYLINVTNVVWFDKKKEYVCLHLRLHEKKTAYELHSAMQTVIKNTFFFNFTVFRFIHWWRHKYV